MDASKLLLEEAPLNRAVNSMMDRWRKAVDLNGLTCFPSVERGMLFPSEDVDPDLYPAIRVWHESADYNTPASQFMVTDASPLVSIYLIMPIGPFKDNQYVDVQSIRECLLKKMFDSLIPPTFNNADGLEPDRFWKFTEGQTLHVEHAQPYKKHGYQVVVQPPWYVSRVDIKINVYNLER